MSGTFTIRRVSQFESQVFGQEFHARFASVISTVSGRIGDSLFGTGVDDGRGVFGFGPVKMQQINES